MFQLFKIEWLKIKNYRTFWILFGAFMLLLPVTFFIVASQFMLQFTGKSMEEVMLKNLMGSPFVFPKVWHSAAWFGGMFFIIIGMLFIMLITNEVHYKTHRQNIIDGWSRMDFIKAKSTLLIFFVLSSTVLVFVCGLLCGLIYTPDLSAASLFEDIHYVAYYTLMAMLYLIVAFIIAILIKRTGLAIIIYFGFVFIVDNLLWLALTYKKLQAGYFLPLETVDSLVPNPFKPAVMEFRSIPDMYLIITSLIYGAALLYIIIKYYKKVDLTS